MEVQPGLDPEWYLYEEEEEEEEEGDYEGEFAPAEEDEEYYDGELVEEEGYDDESQEVGEESTTSDVREGSVEELTTELGVDLTKHNSVPRQEPGTSLSTEELKLRCKQRTGTLFFMALRIIRGGIVHEARHDLESFYWLLLWIVLRHTRHNHPKGARACEAVFDGDDDDTCISKKNSWLNSLDPHIGPRLVVIGNMPLTTLLEDFRVLCLRTMSPFIETEPLTYEKVLDIFNDALKKEWPSDDRARPFVLPNDDDKVPRPEGSERLKSDVNSSRIQSSGQRSGQSVPPPQAGPSGQSHQAGSRTRQQAAAQAGGSGARAASGSRAGKRSFERRDTSEVEPDRSKRTRTASDHVQGRSAPARRRRSTRR
ncbi:uncharacterized protein B0H18DRAFT_1040196 [Fomitopsis serialis]|uniref:uncharacterized protein n=1 Tax=Fomitopsis serialis TaxID=139415 RepID=UPI00200804F1|nr:uncharacterized protein B0H18DRAFT_1040196 [Neoantrodia serialis]KAH9915721.1 hypothetical protein B0H18DRAFT_1040196 [Neoantrodia serialis]